MTNYYLGGWNGENTLNTTELIHPNGSKTEGPIELPEPRDDHCMVVYAGIIILMGGGYATHKDHLNSSAFLTNQQSRLLMQHYHL